MRFEGEREVGEPIAGTVAVRKATARKRRPDHCRAGPMRSSRGHESMGEASDEFRDALERAMSRQLRELLD